MADMIQCPSCQRPLRVPDELIGRPVKCPECGMVFLTVQGAPGAAAAPAQSVQPPATPAGGPAPYVLSEAPVYREVPTGTAAVGPGIAMLVVGLLGIAATAFYLVVFAQFDAQEMQNMLKQQQPDMPQEQVEMTAQFMTGATARTFHGIFLGIDVLIVLGGIALLTRRLYALAVVASILAMINVDGCCCLLGLPVGIWSLLALMRPDVSAAFR